MQETWPPLHSGGPPKLQQFRAVSCLFCGVKFSFFFFHVLYFSHPFFQSILLTRGWGLVSLPKFISLLSEVGGVNFLKATKSNDNFGFQATVCIGYRLRWRSDIWRTDRGVAEVRSPDIRPATEDDIRHNAPGLFETVDQLLRTKVRRKLLNQDKPSRLASYALQQHKAKSARLAASEFSFLLAVLRRSTWVRAVEQAWDENFETSASDRRAW